VPHPLHPARHHLLAHRLNDVPAPHPAHRSRLDRRLDRGGEGIRIATVPYRHAVWTGGRDRGGDRVQRGRRADHLERGEHTRQIALAFHDESRDPFQLRPQPRRLAPTGRDLVLQQHDGMNGFTQAPVAGAGVYLEHVRTPEEVMAGASVGQKVVVCDADGYFVGVGMAEKLLREGHDVTYVTPFEKVAPFTEKTLEAPRLNRTLRELGLKIVDEHIVTAVEPGAVSIAGNWGGESTIEADMTVMVTQRNPMTGLYATLKTGAAALDAAGVTAPYRVGDCEAPNVVAEAMFARHRLAREIDQPNPRVWLPLIRERRLRDSGENDYVADAYAINASV
jgi:hypothetical protein